jgi:hypothetical protein
MTIQTVAEKLHITDIERLFVVGADEDALETIRPLPDDIELTDQVDDADVALAFARSFDEMELRLGDLEDARDDAHLWLVYSKDDVHQTDLDDFDGVAEKGRWRISNRESLDTTWEALRVVRD